LRGLGLHRLLVPRLEGARQVLTVPRELVLIALNVAAVLAKFARVLSNLAAVLADVAVVIAELAAILSDLPRVLPDVLPFRLSVLGVVLSADGRYPERKHEHRAHCDPCDSLHGLLLLGWSMTTYCRDGSPWAAVISGISGRSMQHDGCQCVEGERRRELAQVYGRPCERTGQSSPRRLARSPPAGISTGSAAKQISGSRRGAPRKAGTETVASSAGRRLGPALPVPLRPEWARQRPPRGAWPGLHGHRSGSSRHRQRASLASHRRGAHSRLAAGARSRPR